MATDAVKAPAEERPATELLSGAAGGRCASCGSPMASDQRYCVDCGERRGAPRFPFADVHAGAALAGGVQGALAGGVQGALAGGVQGAPGGGVQGAPGGGGRAAPAPGRSRLSPGTTLLVGVATLLLAMGVGVLIGHDSNTPSPARAPAEVITVGGGAASGAGAGATSTGAASSSIVSSSSARSRSSGAAAASRGRVPPVHVTKQVTQAASQAAKKVLGGSTPNNPTIQPGQSCSAGSAGCQNGRFTGNFFGGG